MERSRKKKSKSKELLTKPMYQISVIEIGKKKHEDIVFASTPDLALRAAYKKWPERDKPPLFTDWNVDKFVGMGVDTTQGEKHGETEKRVDDSGTMGLVQKDKTTGQGHGAREKGIRRKNKKQVTRNKILNAVLNADIFFRHY